MKHFILCYLVKGNGLDLHFVTFGGRSTHLVFSGSKTLIIITILAWKCYAIDTMLQTNTMITILSSSF